MHDPGEHSSPVRLPFGSFPAINILLSHTDILLQTNRARVLCSVCFRVWLQTMQAGKVSNYDSEQDHQRNADYVYTVFFQRTFFFLNNFRERKEKRIFVFAKTTKESFIFLFPGGYSCNTRFFYTWKERLPGFGKPRRLLVIFVF